jgi:hypothetical protein
MVIFSAKSENMHLTCICKLKKHPPTSSIPDFPGLDINSPISSQMAAIKDFFLVSKMEAMK